MRNDDMEFYDEELDEQELLYEISRLQKRLDRMESADFPERDLADEISRLSDELNFLKKERNPHDDDASRYRVKRSSNRTESEKLDRIIEKLEDSPSMDELSKAVLALRKSALMLERSSGEKIASELLALKNVISSCPAVILPAPKKDEIFTIKQFSELTKLLGGFDEKYEKFIAQASIQIDELYNTKEKISSPSVPFIEKLFAILNLYNLLNDNETGREIVENYNLMVSDFFNQNLNAEKLDKIFYLNEVSALYKVSDVIKAKAKRFYSLYDEVLAAKPSKQFDLIKQIYEIKIDLCGKTEEDETAFSKLRDICGKNASLADIRQPLNELMALPMKNIIPPPIMTADAKVTALSPTVSLSDAIKRLTELVEKSLDRSPSAPQAESVKDEEAIALSEKLENIKLAIDELKTRTSEQEGEKEVLSAIRLLRDEVAELSIKLETSEDTLDITEQEDDSGEISDHEDIVEEIDLSDGYSEKLDDILRALNNLTEGLGKERSETQVTNAPSFDIEQIKAEILRTTQETVLNSFEQMRLDFAQTVSTLNAQMNVINEKLNNIEGCVGAKTLQNNTPIPVADNSLKTDGLEAIRTDIKANNKVVSDQLKAVKKDVESIKERNQRIAIISRQMENMKTKVDSIYKANKSEKDAAIIKQLKSLQSSLDRLEKNSVKQENLTALTKRLGDIDHARNPKAVNTDDVSKTINSLKKELSSIMEMVNEDR